MKQFFSGVFTLLFALSVPPIFAQQCGTSFESQYEQREQLFKNRAEREANLQNGTANQRADTQYVPIQFHLVGQSDGSLSANESQLLIMMCELNKYYEDQDIVFYIQHPLNYIYNTSFFNNPDYFGNPAAQLQISSNKVNNAINIFLTGSAGEGSAGFYQGPYPQLDYIVIDKQYMTDQTAGHEVGHFFSLAHPFFGWGQAGDTGWDPNVHGEQVGNFSPQGIPNERMDMSNCTTAADGICDTPPDYFFATSPLHDNDCTWDHEAKDPNGEIVVTKENNIMNYFRPQCNYEFTEDQKTAIWSSLMSSERNYIRHNYVPSTEPITEAPELVYPINGEITPGYNSIEFDWDPVAGATHYILEVDFIPTFTGLPARFIVANGSSKEVEDIFNANSGYYWRVRPYSEGYTCATSWSASGNFIAGSSVSTKNIDEVNDWAVIPNPVSTSEQLTIQVEVSEAFRAGINLYSVTGQQLRSVENQLFTEGSNTYEMNISDLSPGIYVVTIQTNQGIVNKKIVITK